jgi:mannobiose 2-epimerase
MLSLKHLRAIGLLVSALLAIVLSASGLGADDQQPGAALKPRARLPQAEIDKHINRAWVKEASTTGLLDYWVRHSVEANGFIQQNLDRQWKPYGTQREASINGQGRQLYSMAVGFEMTRTAEYRSALTRGMDFMMKMRDPEFGGYFDRVRPDLTVINENKTGFSSFALYSLAIAGRVTGDKRYLDEAMAFFRVVRDKMRDGPFIGGGSYSRDFLRRPAGRAGGPGRGAAAAPGAAGTGRAGAGPPVAAGAGRAGAAPTAPAAPAAVVRYRVPLHMFEALLALYEATKSEEVWYELQQELDVIARVFDHEAGYFAEAYDENWRPVGNPNVGHLFEWASLLSRAVELGADPKFIELGNKTLDRGLQSYNHEVGGLLGVNSATQLMLWWPQCEVVKATANYAALHGRTDLWPIYHKTLEFLKREYFDEEFGGWFPNFSPSQPRSERSPAAFYKGAVDGPEWGAYHQISMYEDLWRISNPDFQFWPTRR